MTRGLKSFGTGFMNITSGAANFAGGVATIVSATNQNKGAGTQVTQNITHERQLTAEEVAILQAEAQAREDQRIYNNAFQSMMYNDYVRQNDTRYATPKSDNTAMYIVGGILMVALIYKITKNKK